MEESRRELIKRTAFSAAGSDIGTMGMPATSYARIKGTNDRVRVRVVGLSDRFKDTLFPCFLNHYKELNLSMVAVFGLFLNS